MNVPDKDVLALALAFKKEMVKAGRGFKFPRASDVTETYAYRDFKSFLDKCVKNELTFLESVELIKAIIKYAKSNGTLKRGTTLLNQSKTVDLLCKKLSNELSVSEDMLNLINKSHSKIVDQADRVKFLTKKPHRHGDPALITMRDQGELNDQYISVSIPCMKVYNSLSTSDKSRMLSLREYVKLKLRVIETIGKDELAKILGSDFNGS